jgi:DNA-binding PadR family transcriptional regulator
MHQRHTHRRFGGPTFAGGPTFGGGSFGGGSFPGGSFPGGPFAAGAPGGPGRHAGFGPGGPGRGGGFGGGRGRRRRGEVRVALLLLLAEEARNGYQLMQAIEERSGGRWRPSPGSIYPTLAQLEDEGLIRATEHEGGKVFELTEQGRGHVQERHEQTPPWEDSDEPEAVADLRTQMRQLRVAAMQVGQAGQNEQIARAAKALAEARRAIYAILAEEADSPSA